LINHSTFEKLIFSAMKDAVLTKFVPAQLTQQESQLNAQ
jgi:hypothetical protein